MQKTIKHIQILSLFVLSLFFSCQNNTSESTPQKSSPSADKKTEYAMVIHGGAGTINKSNMTPEMDSAYRATLNEALLIGEDILKQGGSSEDAVIATISFMEDSPLFNAGRGAVFTHDGINELDASIMTGHDLQAGAVGGLKSFKNPIKAAYAIMKHSDHVLLTGNGAEEFCASQGLERVDPEYFWTESRWQSLQRVLEKEASIGNVSDVNSDYKFGTVGAVALDKKGNITAGTSTGGMTNKRYGRIGDSPIIGAGTYANNATCGVSCTGHGEYFIRYAVAHDVSALMEYKDMSVAEAADYVVNKKLLDANGEGGLIALDNKGNITMPFNSEGMYRAYITDKEKYIAIYKED